MFSNVFFCQCNVVGMMWYMNTHQGRILIFFIMSEISINSVFQRLFCLFGSLVTGFLVIFVLVLLSEGILVSCFLVVHSYCQLILLYTYFSAYGLVNNHKNHKNNEISVPDLHRNK